MTHALMITHAERWVRRVKRCPVVLADVRCTAVNEQPDVIGWSNNGFSTVVECKVSRGDFLRDEKKWFRRSPASGMGYERWIATPTGLITVDELPDRWGLVVLATDGKRMIVARKAEPFHERNDRSERALLVNAVRRATEGWGRRIFGETAPAVVDGDPHPSAARVLRDLRAENLRLREQLRAAPSGSVGDR